MPYCFIWEAWVSELVVDFCSEDLACVFVSGPFSGTVRTFFIISFRFRTFTGDTRNPLASRDKLRKRISRPGLIIGRRKSDEIVVRLSPFVSIWMQLLHTEAYVVVLFYHKPILTTRTFQSCFFSSFDVGRPRVLLNTT